MKSEKNLSDENRGDSGAGCEHVRDLNISALERYRKQSFGICSFCNVNESQIAINHAICLTCGFQGCINKNFSKNHSRLHFRTNPDHCIYFSLINLQICCLICDQIYPSSVVNLGEFLNRAQDFYKGCNFMRSINTLTRFRVVDNSEMGRLAPNQRPAYLISRHKKKQYGLGDIVTVAIKGKTCKAMIVGLKKYSGSYIASMSTNNIILLDENKEPLGTKVTVPIPSIIKKIHGENIKLMSAISKFI